MRLLNVPVVYYDYRGKSIKVNKFQPLPLFPILTRHRYKVDEDLDQLACHYYGEGQEYQTPHILMANAVTLLDSNFDLSQIRELVIPDVE